MVSDILHDSAEDIRETLAKFPHAYEDYDIQRDLAQLLLEMDRIRLILDSKPNIESV